MNNLQLRLEELMARSRWAMPAAIASILIIIMFWGLHGLISHNKGAHNKEDNMPTVDFVRLNRAFDLETKQRQPPKMPEKPAPAPSAPSQKVSMSAAPTPTAVNIGNMSIENSTAVKADFGLSSNDGEYMPIVKVAPMYPPGAQSRGQEGWVLLEFTVNAAGAVTDPVVVEAQPPGVFDEAAKRAVLRFKYKPRIEGGKPISVGHVQHLITFKLDKK